MNLKKIMYSHYSNLFNKICMLQREKVRRRNVHLLDKHRMHLGKKGWILRYTFLKAVAKEVGENVYIAPGVYLSHTEGLILGSNISIHPMTYIDAGGGVEIGTNVSISHGVTILSTSHGYDDMTVPIRNQNLKRSKTTIKDNVWIGAKATILCGITIGSGSIVGANSVVTKNIPENAIVGGNPAKLIKYRE